VKGILRRASRSDAQSLLAAAMEMSTGEEIERFIRAEMERRFGAVGRVILLPSEKVAAGRMRGCAEGESAELMHPSPAASRHPLRRERDDSRRLPHSRQRLRRRVVDGKSRTGAAARFTSAEVLACTMNT